MISGAGKTVQSYKFTMTNPLFSQTKKTKLNCHKKMMEIKV
jgi:hypothetical protein